MSLVGEIFAKEYVENKKIDWRRVVQLSASYNWENGNFDVRLQLSELEDLKEEILKEFLKFFRNLKEPYLPFGKSPLFYFQGSEEEIWSRIKREIEKKKKIQPLIIETAKKFTNELVRKLYILGPMVFITGSASPRSNKIFWYYEDKNENIYISDVDVEILFPYYEKEILDSVKKEAYNFSLNEKIPINVHLTPVQDADKKIFRYGYPIFIPNEFYDSRLKK